MFQFVALIDTSRILTDLFDFIESFMFMLTRRRGFARLSCDILRTSELSLQGSEKFASCDDVEGKCVDESRKAPDKHGFDEVLS